MCTRHIYARYHAGIDQKLLRHAPSNLTAKEHMTAREMAIRQEPLTFDRPFPALTPAERYYLDVGPRQHASHLQLQNLHCESCSPHPCVRVQVHGYVVVPNTLSTAETERLRTTLLALRDELCSLTDGHSGSERGNCFVRPADRNAKLHFLAHLVGADPAITAYASHPRLVAMCEEYIGGEARIVESNCFINSRDDADEQGRRDSGGTFVPSFHRGTDLPCESHECFCPAHFCSMLCKCPLCLTISCFSRCQMQCTTTSDFHTVTLCVEKSSAFVSLVQFLLPSRSFMRPVRR
eukprot:SAG31_NODE_794_length_12043_cov_7.416192_6_plen_293_part_00